MLHAMCRHNSTTTGHSPLNILQVYIIAKIDYNFQKGKTIGLKNIPVALFKQKLEPWEKVNHKRGRKSTKRLKNLAGDIQNMNESKINLDS